MVIAEEKMPEDGDGMSLVSDRTAETAWSVRTQTKGLETRLAVRQALTTRCKKSPRGFLGLEVIGL
jgi:hypothetical protein